MRKSTVFISAVLTTFALVMLYRVASAYNSNKTAAQTDVEPTSLPAPTATEPPATEPPAPAPADVVLGPEQAAHLAAQVVGNTNLLSAETSNFNGTDAFMVTFTNNDVVYVGLDGQILSVQIAPVKPLVINVPAPTKNKNKNNGGGGRASNSSSNNDDHDEHDDHEEHDD